MLRGGGEFVYYNTYICYQKSKEWKLILTDLLDLPGDKLSAVLYSSDFPFMAFFGES